MRNYKKNRSNIQTIAMIGLIFLTGFFYFGTNKEHNLQKFTNGQTINNLKKKITVQALEAKGEKVIHVLNDQFVLSLPNASVVNEGGILTQEGYVLSDTNTCSDSRPLDQHGIMKKNKDLNEEDRFYFDGKLAVISSTGSENWYHWLFQVLPRLIVLKESNIPFDRIYINNLVYDWQKKSLNAFLDYLKIPKNKILSLKGDCIIQARELIVPSVPFIPIKGNSLPKWYQEKFKTIFAVKQSNSSFRKLYISRRSPFKRCIKNEDQLIPILKEHGFEIVILEKLSVAEQARLFSQAKIIIGPHGSGFTNLIFANPGCVVVEIDRYIYGKNYHANSQRSFYKRMTEYMDGIYKPFYCERINADSLSEDEVNSRLEEDMIVDISSFKDVLKTFKA